MNHTILTTNPYEADPEKIPETDLYRAEPFYGRYLPKDTDFVPDAEFINSTTSESLAYWKKVLDDCTELNRVYPSEEGGRDVFALGSVIIKSSHLKSDLEGRRSTRDYSYADANEVKAIPLARAVLGDIKVPRVYFAAKIDGRDVFVQERIPGVGLNVAWDYLSQLQKDSFKKEARRVLQKLRTVAPPDEMKEKSYVVEDPDPVKHRGIQELERDLLFGKLNSDSDLAFMHNDLTQSNIIVDKDRIVGVVDWEMAGFFGWATAAAVHTQIRSPRREYFAHLDFSEERMKDMLFWNDLYETD
ncbi:kinase-like domain-containing protein [Xylariaceae sp. FL0594]|nr:kinase-like domain-containing protein [Xylariaceae sp. FL0594]